MQKQFKENIINYDTSSFFKKQQISSAYSYIFFFIITKTASHFAKKKQLSHDNSAGQNRK